MIYKLVIPGPIEDVTEIRVLEWHGAENHTFTPGDLIVELETHKALIEIRAGQHGILRVVLCPEGAWEKIGAPLAILSDDVRERLPTSPDDLAACQISFEIT